MNYKSILGKSYQILNDQLFAGNLPVPRFEIDTAIKSIFHYRDAVVFVGVDLTKSSIQEILDELLHVMVHMWNEMRGIVDHNHNQYHNKRFCDSALAKGLYVAHHPTRGWSLTSSIHKTGHSKIRHPELNSSLKRHKALILVRRNISNDFFSAMRHEISVIIDKKPRKEFQLKYICGCNPPFIIRSGRRPNGPKPLSVICEFCETKFVIDRTK